MSCENCVTGHLHNGTPSGEVTTLGDVPTYVSKPKDGSKQKSLLFITDIFGWEIPNARLLADEYAAQGFHTYVPDFLENDPFPIENLKLLAPLPTDHKPEGIIEKVIDQGPVMAHFGIWAMKHREAEVRPLIDRVIDVLRADPETGSLSVIGFCWGGYHATALAQEGSRIDTAVACHPAGVDTTTLEKVVKPYSLHVGGEDSFFPPSSAHEAEETLKKKNAAYEVIIYPGQVHGFAVRGDLQQKDIKEGRERCFANTVQFLKKY